VETEKLIIEDASRDNEEWLFQRVSLWQGLYWPGPLLPQHLKTLEVTRSLWAFELALFSVTPCL